jgi:hypothetical protein
VGGGDNLVEVGGSVAFPEALGRKVRANSKYTSQKPGSFSRLVINLILKKRVGKEI